MSYTISVAAATAAVGYDLLTGYPEIKNSLAWRKLNSVACVGSTNPGDFQFELKMGTTLLGTFFNTTGGANKVPLETDRKYIGKWIPKNTELVATVTNAADASDVCLEFIFGRGNSRRRYYARWRRPYTPASNQAPAAPTYRYPYRRY